MRYLNRFFYLLILLSLIIFQPNAGFAKGDKNAKGNSLQKVNGAPLATWFTINNVATILRNDGMSDLNGNDSGFEYPNGSNKTVFFESGFLYGGLYKGEWRVGGSTYNHSQVGGRILDDGSAEDPGLPHVRIYRVRRDYKDPDADFSKEMNKDGLSKAEIIDQYKTDWDNWPAQYGAPFEDTDGNGVYNPALDIPGVPGADQTIWFVNNDLDPSANQQFYGTLGLGFEMQATIWGYNTTGALGNAMFRRYTIVNKGGENVDSMYVCMWSDPDLGDASDDFTGCDTTLSLGFIYNGDNDDGQYGANPPAGGFDFFQGPIVEGEPTDHAIFKGQILQGYKNLPMSAYFFFINSDNVYTDPALNQPIGATQMRNLFEGKISTTGVPFQDPLTGVATKFTLAGDPITSRGWIDGILHSPGDRRLGMVAGPFNFAAGDTQEVVVGQFVAGATEGIDRLGAVGLLKFYDLELQQAYDNFFSVPPTVRAPVVTAVASDQKVSLVWGDREDIYTQTEGYDNLGYQFEGYCVYQLPSATATLEQAKLVETFDIVNLYQRIESTVFDPGTSTITKKFTKFGTDSGIKRSIVIEKDAMRNGQPIVNGTEYYFAVTAYVYNPDPEAVPNVIETPLTVFTIVPQGPNPGVSIGLSGEELDVNHVGLSDGVVEAIVVDPSKTTGHNYKVNFKLDENTGEYLWDLIDVTAGNKVVLGDQVQTEAYTTRIVDGLQLRVYGPPVGINNYSFTPSAARWFTGVNWGGSSFFGGLDIGPYFFGSSVSADQYVTVEVRFKTTATGQKAYRYVRGATPSYGYQDYMPQHFEVWDVTSQPNRQLAAGYVEQNGSEAANSLWQPTASNADREYLFIFNTPYTPEPDPFYTSPDRNFSANADEFPTLYALWPLQRGTMPFNPQDGQVFKITPNFANSGGDTFTFTSPAVTYNADQAATDIEKINAFPNPYYGVNPREVNKYQKYITFSHLPQKATIRIFNLAGQLVNSIDKDDVSPFAKWNLSNDANIPVASGLYIVHVDMPEIGATKILKVAIIQEQQILDRF